jgi:hypothetical protein
MLNSSKNQSGITYTQVIKAVIKGARATRQVWGSDDIFVFMAASRSMEPEYVQSSPVFPESLKAYYRKENNIGKKLSIAGFLCLKMMTDIVLGGWTPSPNDVAAEDWIILDEKPKQE